MIPLCQTPQRFYCSLSVLVVVRISHTHKGVSLYRQVTEGVGVLSRVLSQLTVEYKGAGLKHLEPINHEHARFCVEGFYALLILNRHFHSFIHSHQTHSQAETRNMLSVAETLRPWPITVHADTWAVLLSTGACSCDMMRRFMLSIYRRGFELLTCF